MPETFYTSSQYYNLFFQLYFNWGLSMPLNSNMVINNVKIENVHMFVHT